MNSHPGEWTEKKAFGEFVSLGIPEVAKEMIR